MAALATLWPLDFQLRIGPLVFQSTTEDVLLNLGLLFPAGFLWRIARPASRSRAGLDGLALGLGLSSLLEGLQLFLPARCASPTDVLMNGLGAWAGAMAHDALRRRYRDGWLVRVCLTLPLTKLLYLCAPLIALQAWSAGDRLGAAALLPLAAFAARIAAALSRRVRAAGLGTRTAPREREAWAFALGFTGVFCIVSSPLGVHMPRAALVVAGGSALCARVAFALESGVSAGERRFEVASVLRSLPWFAGYLAIVGVQQFAVEPGSHGAARGLFLLRDVAAFSVLGYVLSQLHGRGMFAGWSVYRLSAACALVLAAAFGALRHQPGASDLAELGLLVASAIVGSSIHRAEVGVIRALRGGATGGPGEIDPTAVIFAEPLDRTSSA
jgi:hypothetical protein